MTAQLDLLEPSDLRDGRGEYAATPRWLSQAALEACGLSRPYGELLDAGAGLGHLASAAEELPHPGSLRITALEREADRCAHMRAGHPEWDVIEEDLSGWAHDVTGQKRWDIILCNPPFSRSVEWARALLPLLAHAGHLLMIMPLAHLGGVERHASLYLHRPPWRVCLSPRRPQGQGWHDTREICVVCWRGGVSVPVGGGPLTSFVWLEV